MEIDEAELIVLRDRPIAICDTAYGRFEELEKEGHGASVSEDDRR